MKDTSSAPSSLLEAISAEQPALQRSMQLSERAAQVCFDWPHAEAVLEKVHEEVGELLEAIGQQDQVSQHHELGDLLFALVNLGRHLGLNAENAAHDACGRFQQRFAYIEQSLRQRGHRLEDTPLADLEALWQEAKHHIT